MSMNSAFLRKTRINLTLLIINATFFIRVQRSDPNDFGEGDDISIAEIEYSIDIARKMSSEGFCPSGNLASLDLPIKATADEAILAKLATTQAGYYVDPFLESCLPRSTGFTNSEGVGSINSSSSSNNNSSSKDCTPRRRAIQPIIKRGTHARVCVMDRAIAAFLKITHESCQIVVLGAGKDTSYFRFCSGSIMGLEDTDFATRRNFQWYEVDHTSVIQEKAALIRQSKLLSTFCPDLKETTYGYQAKTESGSTHSYSLHLVGHDLRESPTQLLKKLSLLPALPTLFLMECVSMYVPVTASQLLLQELSQCAGQVFIACYEPILGKGTRPDPFGRMMERNLINAGVASPESCLLQTRTLPDQLQKLVDCGFVEAVGCDMWSAYETVVTEAQRKRANQSEFLDEYEEWILIMQHYCFMVGITNPSSSSFTEAKDGNHTTNESSLLGFVSNKCTKLKRL
jgi:O-methyltransferase involved in polyketide biosynthesis